MQTPSGQSLQRFTPKGSADVHAAKVKSVVTKGSKATITFVDDYYLPSEIDKKVLDGSKPEDGDYYVVAPDGKAGFMSAADFEAGYKVAV